MQNANKRKYGAVAVLIVALVGVGSALAASKIHLNSGSNRAAGGPPGFNPQGGHGPGFRGARGGGLEAAAAYLGLSTSQLFSALQSGKSLADIAKSTDGKTVQLLIDATVAAEKKQLADAVSRGMLTQDQADQMQTNVESRVTAMVNGQFGFGRRGGFGPPNGRDGNAPPTPGQTT